MNNLKVAQNPNTPIETLKVLATDQNYLVRWGVAHNPNTPAETLKDLATDKDFGVRWEVARHPNTPIEIHKLVDAYEFIQKLEDTSQTGTTILQNS